MLATSVEAAQTNGQVVDSAQTTGNVFVKVSEIQTTTTSEGGETITKVTEIVTEDIVEPESTSEIEETDEEGKLNDDELEAEFVEEDLVEVDTANIVPTRTRGVKIDFQGKDVEGDDEESGEMDADFVEVEKVIITLQEETVETAETGDEDDEAMDIQEDEKDLDFAEEDLIEVDTANIVPTRTRGVKIDFAGKDVEGADVEGGDDMDEDYA
ncbi:hypothetical protein DFS34DRAFT_609020 [Phlyctochytrium arcticum]|nr:hypothetical protein DFS34DRAFT_609020 [Phlyctochytrium arcticum]